MLACLITQHKHEEKPKQTGEIYSTYICKKPPKLVGKHQQDIHLTPSMKLFAKVHAKICLDLFNIDKENLIMKQ